MALQIDLAEYLWRRLAEIGIQSVHGVPGDYNLTVLDYLDSAGIHWVGNANELNSGYAADGYARIKGIGALVTSFGVGELSAINAIGGAYSEKVPVVHIVGTPPVAAQKAGACLHHSLGDGNFRVFAEMFKSVTVSQANLSNPSTASLLIDTTLQNCVRHSRPVYIELPSDMVKTKVAEPSTPLDLSIPGYNEAFEDQLVHKLVGRIQDSKRPMILIDAFAAGFCVNAEINDLVRETDFPTLATPGGKGVVDEHLPNFHGVHLGSAGTSAHQAWAGARDLVLHFGPLNSDTNTFGFTAIPNPQVTVAFERHSVQIGGTDEILTGGCSISIKATLNKLLARLRTLRRSAPDPYPNECQTPREALRKLPKPRDESAVDQYSFWLLISTYIKSGDIVLTETGTASYGSHSLILPGETVAINSTIWLSIGYMLAACQGASLAQKEMCEAGTRRPGRTILFVGDGSLQMSAQAVSDMIRNRLNVTIFILNNNGYTIERLIHGPNATYNDVQPWRNLEAPSYFGAPKDEPSYPVRTFAAQNWGELQKIINNAGLKKGNGLNMVEVKMGVDDAPQSLRSFAEYLEMRNRGEV